MTCFSFRSETKKVVTKTNKKGKKVNEKKNTKISKRDLEVARFIAEQGPLRINTVGKYLEIKEIGVDARGLRRIIKKLEDVGLLRRRQILAGSSIVWGTKSGLRLAGVPVDSKNTLSEPSMETIVHSTYVAEIRLVYEKNGAEWICERKLHEEFPNHLPDGLAIYNNQKIIVEVDRTRKSHERLVNIMRTNVFANSTGYIVDYWVPEELYKLVNSSKMLLPEVVRENIRVFIISGESQ